MRTLGRQIPGFFFFGSINELISKYGDDGSNYKLFLSSYSKKLDDADLFIYVNASYGIYVESGYRGWSYSLIADIGDIQLEEVTMYKSTTPKWQIGFSHNFRRQAKLEEKHTYTVNISTSAARGVLVFRVEAINGNQVIISYVLKSYEALTKIEVSPGLDYNSLNQR